MRPFRLTGEGVVFELPKSFGEPTGGTSMGVLTTDSLDDLDYTEEMYTPRPQLPFQVRYSHKDPRPKISIDDFVQALLNVIDDLFASSTSIKFELYKRLNSHLSTQLNASLSTLSQMPHQTLESINNTEIVEFDEFGIMSERYASPSLVNSFLESLQTFVIDNRERESVYSDEDLEAFR